MLHLGDYLYEYKKGSYVIAVGNLRDHEGPETSSLAGRTFRPAAWLPRHPVEVLTAPGRAVSCGT